MSETASAPSSLRPTLFHLALAIPWIAIVLNAFEGITDNSFLWHVRAGDVQLTRGEVLTTDPFSFTMSGQPWRTQSWLPEVGYGWMETVAGLDLTSPMVLVVSFVVFIGVGAVAHRNSQSVPTVAVVLLLTAVILPRFIVPRPVLFSYLLFLLVILAWERAGSRWTVPFLFWLWAATHGSFVIGLTYVGLRIIQKRRWTALRTAVLSLVVTLGTAHGLGVVTMLVDFVEARQYLGLMSEWRNPDFLEPDLLPFAAMIVLIMYGAAKRRIEAADLWVIVPFLVLAFSAQRSISFAWIALLPLLARSLGTIKARWARGFSQPAALVLLVAVLVLPFVLADSGDLDNERFPVSAAAQLDDVHTFHDDATGGYLIWRHGPERKVFIDDRVELYGSRLEELVQVRTGLRSWEPVFRRDGIVQALLKTNEPLVEDLEESGWRASYRDETFVVLVIP